MLRTRLALCFALVLTGCKEERACTKMKTLCGTELDECKELRASVRKELGDTAVDKLDACFLSSASCGEATGCSAGAALKGTGEAAKEFFDGLKKELEKK